MSIRVRCPGCDAEYALADSLAGKKVRCKKCQGILTVKPTPDDEEFPKKRPAAGVRAGRPRPEAERRRPAGTPDRRRRAREDDDEDDRPVREKGGGLAFGLVLGGIGAALLLVVGCGGAATLFLLRVPAPATYPPLAAVNPLAAPPPNNGAPNNPAGPPSPVQPDPPPNGAPPVLPQPLFQPPPPPPAAPWLVQPDPLPADLALPDNPKATIPIAGLISPVVYPTSPSPFVSVAGKIGFNETREVWDLRSGKRIGVIAPSSPIVNPSLSPDGAYLVAPAFIGGKPTAQVWSVADGRDGKIVVDEKPGFLQDVDFAGPGQVMTAKPAGLDLFVQIWDVKTGAELRRFTAAAQPDRKQRAFSAGRKYLALFGRTNDRVLIYDLAAGQPAGALPVPANSLCQGLTFSADGKSLAGLFGMGLAARLQVWDVATGKPSPERLLDQNPVNVVQNGYSYQGPPVEWLPDGSGLLLYGQQLMDPGSGVVYWKLAAGATDVNPRRVFGNGRVAFAKGDPLHKVLVVEALPADRLAAALKAVGTGQDPNATALPDAQTADWSAVRELPAPAGGVEWRAKADPALAPKAGLGARPIPLGGKAGDLARVLFSRPDVGQAAVLSAAEQDTLGDHRQVRVDRYDLASGKLLGGFELFAADFPKGPTPGLGADLSPDGSLLAVREPRQGKRIDLWSTADGRRVAGWLPYEKEADASIRWFAFVDEKRLFTLSRAGRLTLWDAPERRALYSASFVHDTPALSPGRKYLAAYTGSNFEVLESATGERVGQLFGPNAQAAEGAAFGPDGRELAAVLNTADGLRLARWDAVTGTARGDFAVTSGMGEAQWCGPDHLLVGRALIDLNLKWPTALYMPPGIGPQPSAGPDGRLWFAVGRAVNDPPLLAAQTVPDPATRQFEKLAAAGQIVPAAAPGMTVNVRVDGAVPDGDADAFRRDVTNRLTQRLQSLGFKTGQGGTLTLALQIQAPRDIGQVHKYQTLGFPNRVIDVHVQEAAVQASLLDAGGGVLWTQKSAFQTPDTIGLVRADDLQATLNKQMWSGVSGWAGSVVPPAVLIRVPAGIEALPRMVLLTGDR